MLERGRLALAASIIACAFGCNGSGSGGTNGASSTAKITSGTVGTVVSIGSASTVTAVTSKAAPNTSPSTFLYVSNFESNTISAYDLDGTTGVPTLATSPDTTLPTGFGPLTLATDPTGTILFSTGGGSGTGNQVVPMSITGGVLTVGQPDTTASPWPGVLAVDPTAAALYTADQNPGQTSGTLSVFSYAAGTGALQSGTPLGFGIAGGPTALVCDPSGKFLYVADDADQLVRSISITNGTLGNSGSVAVSGSTGGPYSIAVNPAGTFLWTGNSDGTICTYPLKNGALGTATITSASNSAAATPNVVGLAVDPLGKYLVAANGGAALGGGSDEVAAFSIGSNGAPTLLGSPVVISGAAPASVIFNQNGTVVYAANFGNNTVSAFTVSSTGLAAITGSPYALPAGDTGPTSLAVTR